MENKKIPEVRFKGFSEEWKEKFVESLCSISTGNSNTQDKVKDGQYPFYVRSATIEKSDKYLFDEEAVLTVGDGVGTGKVYHYVNGKYDLHQRVYRMYDFKEITGKFFYSVFSENFQKRVSAMSAKTSVDSVRMEMISRMKISSPAELEEQTKLGSFFENLDQLINQHQKQHKKLNALKKAMLSKLFPKQGETVPEIRFKGFTGDWEMKKLEWLCDIQAGGDVHKLNFSKTITSTHKYPVFANALVKNGLYGYSDKPKITQDCVTVTGRGDVGFAVDRKANFTAVVRLLVLFPKHKTPTTFLKIAINQINIKFESTGVPQLTAPQISKYEIKLPTLIDEQQKIGDYFQNLDSLIENHSKQIEKLSVLKKACLSKMFV